MNKSKTYQITAVIITLIGKGLDTTQGYVIMFFGVALSFFILLFGKKIKETIDYSEKKSKRLLLNN